MARDTPMNQRAFRIDVSRRVEEMERILRVGADLNRAREVLAILQRWQFDEMLDDASRERAKRLVKASATNEWGKL